MYTGRFAGHGQSLQQTLLTINHVDQIQVPVPPAYGEYGHWVPVSTERDLATKLKNRGKLYDLSSLCLNHCDVGSEQAAIAPGRS